MTKMVLFEMRWLNKYKQVITYWKRIIKFLFFMINIFGLNFMDYVQ